MYFLLVSPKDLEGPREDAWMDAVEGYGKLGARQDGSTFFAPLFFLKASCYV